MAGEPDTPIIVVAYDGSDGARTAIDAVPDLLTRRQVVVLTAWSPLSALVGASLIAIPAGVASEASKRLDQHAEEHASSVAEEGAERLRVHGLEASSLALRGEGRAWVTIAGFAEKRAAALVVLGSRGLSGARSVLLGSTSRAVLQHCSRPVLIVPPGETTVADPG